ncbi:Ubiquinol-cytochrome C reductase iron-sulfur subunit [hydrothermal vent metagenome]|uniref:Ubiquinol-cytochrome c reductase iron-sulfur subunit n=1 Tax=hydrothermal vent metagenome TaxID=652676 RepID=A0A3B0SZL3_9ZZZZ
MHTQETIAPEPHRRDFIHIATGGFAIMGGGLAMWPFIDSLNPSADVMASSKIDVDLSPMDVGLRLTVKWGGKPVFICRRTPEEIAEAELDDNNQKLIDPAKDSERAQNKQWLIVIGICTHLGCVPLGQRVPRNRGPWNGWFCPCHGSIYDTAGRVRRGPAPRNLDLPPYVINNLIASIG